MLASKRLRTSVLTLVRGVEEEDLDLTGISATMENIRNGCPVQASQANPKDSAQEGKCGVEMIAKMKAKGMNDAAIREICS